MWVTTQDRGQVLVRATPDYIVLDRHVAGDEWERVRDFPLGDVVSIEIEAIQNTHVSFGFLTTMTGFGKRNPNITGVLVVLRDGEHIMWAVQGKAPIEVKAQHGRVMALIGS